MNEKEIILFDGEPKEALVAKALFDRSVRFPYYIVAPRYLETSAGISVLYRLCHLLNVIGEEAYVVSDNGAHLNNHPAPHLRASILAQLDADRHFIEGRCPIVIYSETASESLGVGVAVRYVMNYAGLLGGPGTFENTQYVLSYTENIARSLDVPSQVMYLPVSDPNYWTPGPKTERKLKCVYAGKYVDYHGGTIPAHILEGAVLITRDKIFSQTRDELREIFRQASVLYVFENTALAAEAALCGCPVVCIRNDFFHELTAEHELGWDGFALSDEPDALLAARNTVSKFRDSYTSALSKVGASLVQFVELSQRMAGSMTLEHPAKLPRSASIRRVEEISFLARRLTISAGEIGILETARRGLRSVLGRAGRFRVE